MNQDRYFRAVSDDDLSNGMLWNQCSRRMREIESAALKAAGAAASKVSDEKVKGHLRHFNPEFQEAGKKMLHILRNDLKSGVSQ